MLNANSARRIGGRGLNRLTERNAHLDRRAHAVHQVGCGTRNRAVVQRSEVAAHGNRLSAERILAVIQSGRIMLSEIRITRFSNSRNVARTTDGCTCTPSAMSSTATLSLSKAAPITPGARCENGGMALYRWVTCRAPCLKASQAVS